MGACRTPDTPVTASRRTWAVSLFTIYATKAGARDFSLFFSEAIGTFFTRYEMMKGTRMFITEASRTGQWGLHEWRLFGGRAGHQSFAVCAVYAMPGPTHCDVM